VEFQPSKISHLLYLSNPKQVCYRKKEKVLLIEIFSILKVGLSSLAGLNSISALSELLYFINNELKLFDFEDQILN